MRLLIHKETESFNLPGLRRKLMCSVGMTGKSKDESEEEVRSICERTRRGAQKRTFGARNVSDLYTMQILSERVQI